MAFLDQYIVNNTDRTLRLVSALDAGRSALQVVRVGSREFQRYVDQGYRMHNPHHHNAALGLHRVMQLTMPGYAIANEMVGGHGAQSRSLAAKRRRVNPEDIGQLTYTNWAAVLLMKKRAAEMGQPELVKVFAESNANYAHQQIKTAVGMGKLPSRFTFAPFNVTDRKRVYGYAPEPWIEEEGDDAREVEDKATEKKVDAMIAKTKEIQATTMAEVKKQVEEIQAKLDPKVEALEKAVDQHIEEIESKGADAKPDSLAAKRVKLRASDILKAIPSLKKMVKIGKGAYTGAKSGWAGHSGWEIDRDTKSYASSKAKERSAAKAKAKKKTKAKGKGK